MAGAKGYIESKWRQKMTPAEFEQRMKKLLKSGDKRSALVLILTCLIDNGFAAGVEAYNALLEKNNG